MTSPPKRCNNCFGTGRVMKSIKRGMHLVRVVCPACKQKDEKPARTCAEVNEDMKKKGFI